MRAWWRVQVARWLAQRLPRANQFTLTQRNLFIFLNQQALFYLLIAALLWIGASNFENNLIYSLCFLLLSVLVAGIFFTFNNLSGLTVSALPVPPVFAGDAIAVPLQLISGKQRQHLQLQFEQMPAVTAACEAQTNLQLLAPPLPRGRHFLPRIQIASVYPLGFIRCWTFLHPAQTVWVYPQPIVCDLQLCNAGSGSQQGSAARAGTDEFHSLKAYRPGDSLVRVAWKQYAAGRGLLVSEYDAQKYSGDWLLDYDQLTDSDPELRLSKLCYAVLQLSQSSQPFALKLPHYNLAKATGIAHEQAALQALALFGQSTDATS